MKDRAFVVLVSGDGEEGLNVAGFQKGIVDYGRDKGWVVWRDVIAGAEGADGVIAYGIGGRDVAKLAEGGRSIIWAQRERPENGFAVNWDDGEIGRLGARHFAESGFRKLGFLLGEWGSSRERWRGFCEEAAAMGLDDPVVLRLPDFAKVGMGWLLELGGRLRGLEGPIGVMAPTDRLGNDLLYAAEMAGLNVPEEVAVLGVGNDGAECELGPVGLSSVEAGAVRQGAVAAEELDRMMAGYGIVDGEILIGPEKVMVRRSSDVRVVPHVKAVMALQFIRRNYGESELSVDRVAEAVGMSRRGLEDAFRNHVSRGIGQAITEMRIRIAKEMLASSRRNVGEVAVLVGFRNSQYFHRCFARMVGMTPGEFRRNSKEKCGGDEG